MSHSNTSLTLKKIHLVITYFTKNLTVFRFVFIILIPFSLLLFFNSTIYQSMRKNRSGRESSSSILVFIGKVRKNIKKYKKVLQYYNLVLLFIIFNLPGVVINIADIFLHYGFGEWHSEGFYYFQNCNNYYIVIAKMPRLPGQIIHLIARLSAFKFIVLGISLENWSGCITTPRWYLLLLSLNHLFLTLNRLVNGPKW